MYPEEANLQRQNMHEGLYCAGFWVEWRMTVSGYKDPTWDDENTLKPANSEAVQVHDERNIRWSAHSKWVKWCCGQIPQLMKPFSSTLSNKPHSSPVWVTFVATVGNNLEEGIKTTSINYGEEFNWAGMVNGRERRTLMQDDIRNKKSTGTWRARQLRVEKTQGHNWVSIPQNLQGGRVSVNPKNLKAQL